VYDHNYWVCEDSEDVIDAALKELYQHWSEVAGYPQYGGDSKKVRLKYKHNTKSDSVVLGQKQHVTRYALFYLNFKTVRLKRGCCDVPKAEADSVTQYTWRRMVVWFAMTKWKGSSCVYITKRFLNRQTRVPIGDSEDFWTQSTTYNLVSVHSSAVTHGGTTTTGLSKPKINL
jgi:hypothetical protein